MTSGSSSGFERLSPAIKRWIWQQGWTELRDIQERAIAPILERKDVLVSSATASGKTEAAFLPVASAVSHSARDVLAVLYVAPLKALINDQERRLSSMFEAVAAPVTPWHGDVPSARKRRLAERPVGALLITPESLEALFVLRGTQTRRIFANLEYIVVDELHAFIGAERGRQLQSLLHRVDIARGASIPRVALSATIGDLDLAADFLRPGHGDDIVRVESSSSRHDIQLQLRGYLAASDPAKAADPVDARIAEHLFGVVRGGTHLVFANRRLDVEKYADLLRQRCESASLPNEFWAHHGSLSRELREAAEAALRSEQAATVIATSTLELGIDVGSVDSVAQIGPPGSVASLRQRLGRSGRRADQASTLRIYVREPEIDSRTPVVDRLRPHLVQSIAAVQLMLARWVEPPASAALHLSTLVQQTLSLAAQFGGFRANVAYQVLCVDGPFTSVTSSMFDRFLRDLAEHDLIGQTHDGQLVVGLAGERLIGHYDFYAAFASTAEWHLTSEGKSLGTLPVTTPLAPDLFLVFGGRRWRIIAVDERRRQVDLVPAGGGQPPDFGGGAALVHGRIREEMRAVLDGSDVPPYLDATGRDLLAEGRDHFRRLRLEDHPILEVGRDALAFLWTGDRAMNTLVLEFKALGFAVESEGVALLLRNTSRDVVRAAMVEIAESGVRDPVLLASGAADLQTEKHHQYLSRELLMADYASSRLDSREATEAVRRTVLRP